MGQWWLALQYTEESRAAGATFPREAVGLVGMTRAVGSFRMIVARMALIWRSCGSRARFDVVHGRDDGDVDATSDVFPSTRRQCIAGAEHFDFSATTRRLLSSGLSVLLDALDAPGADGLPRAARGLSAGACRGTAHIGGLRE